MVRSLPMADDVTKNPAPATTDDQRRRLSPEEWDRVKAWIEKQGKRGCPICGTGKWSLSWDVAEISSHYPKVHLGSRFVYPLVVVTCETCFHVFSFNAIRLGILKSRDVEGGRQSDGGA